MPLRKEPPTPRSAAASARLDSTNHASNSTTPSLGPLIPFKPGQTSLRNQAILTEDEYTSALSSIIKRDFFPNLDRLTAENDYLAAVESDDPARIRLALNRLLQLDGGSTPQRSKKQRRSNVHGVMPKRTGDRDEWDDTPVASGSGSRVFDPTFTPVDASEPDVPPQQVEAEPQSGIAPEPGLSLAQFQARYTSEDNASFSQLLDRDNQQRKRKYAHLFAREQASHLRRKQIAEAELKEAQKGTKLAIEANPEHPKLVEQANAPLLIGDGSGKGKQKEVEAQEKMHGTRRDDPMDDLILVPEPRKDDRVAPAGHTRWKYIARNALIYGPDANSNPLHAQPSSASTRSSSSENDAPQPSTNFSALRFRDEQAGATEREGSEAGWSPSSTRVNAAIQRGRAGSIASSTDDTPKVNGYGFVTPYSTPQHSHSTAGETQHEMHLRIYNAIKASRSGSTPAAEEGAGEGAQGRHFELPRLDKRERAAQRLLSTTSPAAGASTPYGVAKYTGLSALKTRRFASPRADARQLTPAARALLDRSTRGLTPSSGGVASPMAQRSSGPGGGKESNVGGRAWTPTPQHRPRLP